MIITGMAHFQSVCKKKLVEWHNKNGLADTPVTPPIDLSLPQTPAAEAVRKAQARALQSQPLTSEGLQKGTRSLTR